VADLKRELGLLVITGKMTKSGVCKETNPIGDKMTKHQSHTLKLKMSLFAEATAMIEYAKNKGQAQLDLALAERDRTRIELFAMIDSLTTEE
jgi:hypothetical protein